MSSCIPELGIVNESIGDPSQHQSPIDKLPGNNPLWRAEDGKATDPNYVETATMVSVTPHIPEGWSMIGCLARDANKPDVFAFSDPGVRELGVKHDMSPDYCLNKCGDYGVSIAGQIQSWQSH